MKAVNNFVFIKVDDKPNEIGGLILPDSGKVKPNTGKVLSVGAQTKDHNLKNAVGKTVIYPQGVGWETEVDGATFLVLETERVWGIK